MSRLPIFFLFLIFILSENVMACNLDRQVVEDEATGQSNRYYSGLVKIKYFQYNKDGSFKEAGLQPFMMYKFKEGIDLKKPIIIKYDGKEQPCNFYNPAIGKIMDVDIIEENGAYYTTELFLGALWRVKNVEYVGDE